MTKYKRILLKLSGEALSGDSDSIFDFDFMKTVAKQIKRCKDEGVQVAIVIGGGNIWRGKTGTQITRTCSDNIGMLATTINSLAMSACLEDEGVSTTVMSGIQMDKIAPFYTAESAISNLEKGNVVIISCGSSNPFFSTDTAAVLRAAELCADISLFAKNIDAVYTADPRKDANAVRLDRITYDEILKNNLEAIDFTASAFGRENNLKILVFGLADPENIYRAVCGEKLGTLIEK